MEDHQNLVSLQNDLKLAAEIGQSLLQSNTFLENALQERDERIMELETLLQKAVSENVHLQRDERSLLAYERQMEHTVQSLMLQKSEAEASCAASQKSLRALKSDNENLTHALASATAAIDILREKCSRLDLSLQFQRAKLAEEVASLPESLYGPGFSASLTNTFSAESVQSLTTEEPAFLKNEIKIERHKSRVLGFKLQAILLECKDLKRTIAEYGMSTDGYIYLSSTLEVPESQKERAFSHSNKAGPRCKAGSSVSSRKNSLNHLPRDRQPSGSVREVVNESEIKKLRKVLLKLETVIQESENVYSRETSTCMQILQRETATFRDVAKKLHAIIPDTNDATSKLTIDHEVLKAETETLIRSVESIHQVTVPQQGPSTPCPSGIATKLSSIQSKLQTVIQDCQKIICESKPYQISQESAKLFEVSRKLQIVTQERDELRKIIAEYQEMISDCQRDIQNEILEPEGERLDHLLYRGNHTDVQTQTENRVPSEMSDKEAIACIKRGSWLIKTTRAGRKHLRFVMVDSFKMEVSWYPQTIKGVLPHLKTVSLISFDIINSTSIMIRTPKRSIYLETEVQGQLAVWIQGLNALFERLKTVDGSTNTLNANSQSKIGKSRHILSDVVERSKKRTQE